MKIKMFESSQQGGVKEHVPHEFYLTWTPEWGMNDGDWVVRKGNGFTTSTDFNDATVFSGDFDDAVKEVRLFFKNGKLSKDFYKNGEIRGFEKSAMVDQVKTEAVGASRKRPESQPKLFSGRQPISKLTPELCKEKGYMIGNTPYDWIEDDAWKVLKRVGVTEKDFQNAKNGTHYLMSFHELTKAVRDTLDYDAKYDADVTIALQKYFNNIGTEIEDEPEEGSRAYGESLTEAETVQMTEEERMHYNNLYYDLYDTIMDGSNADVATNIKKAFEKVDGNVRVRIINPQYITYDGKVGGWYTIGGNIPLNDIYYKARMLAEDLTMAAYRTSGGEEFTYTPKFIKYIKNGELDESINEDINNSIGYRDYRSIGDIIEGSTDNMADEQLDSDIAMYNRIGRIFGMSKPDDIVVYVDSANDYNPKYFNGAVIDRKGDGFTVYSFSDKDALDDMLFCAENKNGNNYLYFVSEEDADKYLDAVDHSLNSFEEDDSFNY